MTDSWHLVRPSWVPAHRRADWLGSVVAECRWLLEDFEHETFEETVTLGDYLRELEAEKVERRAVLRVTL